MDFGAKLKARRELAGETQKEVAAVMGITRQAVAKLEAGESKSLNVLNAIALARHWRLSVEDLVFGDPPKQEQQQRTKGHALPPPRSGYVEEGQHAPPARRQRKA